MIKASSLLVAISLTFRMVGLFRMIAKNLNIRLLDSYYYLRIRYKRIHLEMDCSNQAIKARIISFAIGLIYTFNDSLPSIFIR